MSLKNSVPVTISATTAHRTFGDLIRRVRSGTEHFIVERDGLPIVAIISIAEYKSFLQARKHQRKTAGN